MVSRIIKFIKNSPLIKMTSLNSGVIIIRLIISVFLNREISGIVSTGQYAQIGNFRNLMAQLMSLTSLGIFNGIVKYVSEHKEDKAQLQRLFSTATVFTLIGSGIAFLVLFFGAPYFAEKYLGDPSLTYLIKLTAVVVPFISVQRVFNGVVNGLSKYKAFSKIELFAYLISSGLLLWFLYLNQFEGVILAIALTPIIQVGVMLFIMIKVFKEYVQFSKLKLRTPLAKSLLAFTAMSFFSTILLNQVEIEVRNMIEDKISAEEAGVWTGLMMVSKNYMVFINAILTLYVLPKFANIHTRSGFTKELGSIYKTLLPIFGVGMILIYFLREYVILFLFKGEDYFAMAPLFKWQLLGDFVRLASVILASQFFAKKLVYAFIFSEVLSLGLFFGFSIVFIDSYGVEGVPLAHLARYIIYFLVVFFLVIRYFRSKKGQSS